MLWRVYTLYDVKVDVSAVVKAAVLQDAAVIVATAQYYIQRDDMEAGNLTCEHEIFNRCGLCRKLLDPYFVPQVSTSFLALGIEIEWSVCDWLKL